MEWTDAIDILLLAVIVYYAFLVIRGTRAFQILVGLSFLGLLYIISGRMGFFAVRWMLDKFSVYLVLALVILFQTDIRRGLARAGGSFFKGGAGSAESAVHEALVRAAFAMASRRIGALVVIERSASLDELAESGHHIDGVVSQELLLSIFHPTSPLHDGAVVIQNGRLTCAKAFLPLSLSKDIARYYGTRHRAALGLSEETDAVVVVVSEERGAVSLVMSGAMTAVEDQDQLRQRLQEIFQPDRRRGSALAFGA
jgi:diadenylate cyclase